MLSPRLVPNLRRVVPDFGYFVDDLCETSDDELRQRALADFPKVALWLMRDARDIETLLERLTQWAATWEAIAHAPNGTAAIFRLMHYLVMLFEQVHIDRFHARLAMVAPTAQELAMTYGEQLLAQGKAEGKAEGMAQGMVRSLLRTLSGRTGNIPDDARRRIEQCTDLEQLEEWSVRAGKIDRIEELFED